MQFQLNSSLGTVTFSFIDYIIGNSETLRKPRRNMNVNTTNMTKAIRDFRTQEKKNNPTMNVKKLQNVRQPVSLPHFPAMPRNPAKKNHWKYLGFAKKKNKWTTI